MSITKYNGTEIAVIGMAGRFPGAKDVTRFWENLKNGVESVTFFSDEKFKEYGILVHISTAANYVKARVMLEDKEYFDASFFSYSPIEAKVLAPHARLLHECVWDALENAAYNPDTFEGLIGLYAGVSSTFNWEAFCLLSRESQILGDYDSDKLANRDYVCSKISFKLNLKGPSLSMNTTCSTSLVAIHVACQALLNAECDIALAGGVRISVLGKSGYVYEEGMIHSPDGHCRAFDARSKGIIGGEGAGIVVLKPIEEALADGDYIYAVVKGSAINNDGNRKVGFTAPSVKGQAEVIRYAQQAAEIEPESIGYVEAHGTGTVMGDPIELEALKQGFDTTKKQYCAVGSVKTNIGHLVTAAGVAGFIKAVLALKNRLIPPSLHYESPNPKIDFENSPFFVNTKPLEWRREDTPLRAAVSSFGIGGTNAHVILEEAPNTNQYSETSTRNFQLILLSAKSENALQQATENLVCYLKENPDANIADVAYTLQRGRKSFQYKKMTVGSTIPEVCDFLGDASPGNVQVFSSTPETADYPLVFMFPGQGAQYINMGREIYQTEPVFHKYLDTCFEILQPLLGTNVRNLLFPGLLEKSDHTAAYEKIKQTVIAQPLTFSIEYALAKMLMDWGIEPEVMIGHSIGEYTAACLAGVFSLEHTLQIIVARGQLMQKMLPGAMLSVPLSQQEITPFLESKPELSLAAVNGPGFCVVSGSVAAIDRLNQLLKVKEINAKLLHTSHAFHSYLMEPMLQEFENCFAGIQLNAPGIPFISNVTGDFITSRQATDPTYWSAHLRNTVKFSQGVTKLLDNDYSLFLEIGPGTVLSTFVRQLTAEKKQAGIINFLPPQNEKVASDYYLLNSFGSLWFYGKHPDWQKFYAQEKRIRIPLPTYPYQKQRFWPEGDLGRMIFQQFANSEPLRESDFLRMLYIPYWRQVDTPNVVSNDRHRQEGNWLLFNDSSGLGTLLSLRLRTENRNVIEVKPGSLFSKSKKKGFLVDPGRPDDYQELFAQLEADGNLPTIIVHLWNVHDPKDSSENSMIDFAASQDLGFFSIVYLAKAMANLNREIDVKLFLVTDHLLDVIGTEQLHLEKATLLGPMTVIPQEFPQLTLHHIDIVPPPSGDWNTWESLEQLLVEFTAERREKSIAIRGSRKWVKRYEPITTDQIKKHPPRYPLKENGIYLITGGLGNIGYAISHFLAQNLKAKLVLIGRTPLSPGTDLKLKELENLSGQVIYFQGDVSDKKRMSEILTLVEDRFGPVNGVIHAAGLLGSKNPCIFDSITRENANIHFTPKIHGLMVLQEVFKDKNIDFGLVTSSLSTVLGGIGYCAYSAANSFMDYLVKKMNQQKKIRWISVALDGWEQEKNNTQSLPIETTKPVYQLSSQEGVDVIRYILSNLSEDHIIVSVSNLEKRLQKIQKENKDPAKDKTRIRTNKDTQAKQLQSRQNILTPYAPPTNAAEEAIVEIWQELLGYEKIGIDDDFFRLGGNSVNILVMRNRVSQRLQQKIAITKLFLNATIRKLAQNLDTKIQFCHLESIVKLNEGENKQNIFIIHQADGLVHPYEELANHLTDHYNVYGVQARAVGGGSMPENLDEMLNQYILEIRSIQENGPYIIGGYCIGCEFAFEIASLLEGMGQTVKKLIMIDGTPSNPSAIVLKVFDLKISITRVIKQTFKTIQKIFIKDIVQQNKKSDNPLRARLLELYQEYKWKSPVSAPIFVTRAKTKKNPLPDYVHKQWHNMTSGGYTIVDIPGNHNTILTHPNVSELAEVLKNMEES